MKKFIGKITEADRNNLQLISNKIGCANQVLRPDAIPAYAPVTARNRFFREAIFAYADALYLQDIYWCDLAGRYGVSIQEIPKLYVNFDTNDLSLEENRE